MTGITIYGRQSSFDSKRITRSIKKHTFFCIFIDSPTTLESTTTEAKAYDHDGVKQSQAELQVIAHFLHAAKAVTQSNAFARLSSNMNEQRHCVRCHDSYTERQNSNTSCTIPHVFDRELWEPGDACEQFYPSLCCGEDVVVKGWGPGNEETFPDAARLDNCFHGKHTDDPERVYYNGKNTRRCYTMDEQGRACVRKHVKRSMFDGPCWEFYYRPQHRNGAAIDVSYHSALYWNNTDSLQIVLRREIRQKPTEIRVKSSLWTHHKARAGAWPGLSVQGFCRQHYTT